MADRAKASLNQNLILIGAACGECAGTLDGAYLRQAHQRRQRIAEAAGSGSIDGRPTTPERLFAWLGDIPLEGQRNLGAEAYAATIFGLLGGQDSELRAEARGLAARASTEAGSDPIAGANLLFRGRDTITVASRAAFFLFLQKHLGPAEPAISGYFGGLENAARRPGVVFGAFVGEKLAKASAAALENARGLRAAVVTMNRSLGKSRRSSHVREIAELLFAGHPLTFGSAAHIFKISRLSARKHILALERAGLVETATRRKAGRVYAARDGVLRFRAPSPSPARSRPLFVGTTEPLSIAERERLDTISDDILAQMHALDRTLKRLSHGDA